MNIIISNSSGQPIYEQIYSQIKNNIITGVLSSGDPLPSIRAMAKDLRISVITTKRAYDELEKGGYIYTVASKGCYVAEKNINIVKEEYLRAIEEHMKEIALLAPVCGLDDEKLKELYTFVKKEL